MKAITLHYITPPDLSSVFIENKKFRVQLGNNRWFYFTDKRKAEKFLNRVSKLLTFRLHEANRIFSDLYCIYRQNWFVIENNYFFTETFGTVEKTFELMAARGDRSSANYNVFGWFKNLVNCFSQILTAIKKIYLRFNKHSDIHDLETIYNRVIKLESDVFDCHLLEPVLKTNVDYDMRPLLKVVR